MQDDSVLRQGVSGGVKAAKAGHEVIMSPTSHCYFDYRQSLKYGRTSYTLFPLNNKVTRVGHAILACTRS